MADTLAVILQQHCFNLPEITLLSRSNDPVITRFYLDARLIKNRCVIGCGLTVGICVGGCV